MNLYNYIPDEIDETVGELLEDRFQRHAEFYLGALLRGEAIDEPGFFFKEVSAAIDRLEGGVVPLISLWDLEGSQVLSDLRLGEIVQKLREMLEKMRTELVEE